MLQVRYSETSGVVREVGLYAGIFMKKRAGTMVVDLPTVSDLDERLLSVERKIDELCLSKEVKE